MSPRNGPGPPVEASLPEWPGSPDSSGSVFGISSVTTVGLFMVADSRPVYTAPSLPCQKKPRRVPERFFRGRPHAGRPRALASLHGRGDVEDNEPSLEFQQGGKARQIKAAGVSGPPAGAAG